MTHDNGLIWQVSIWEFLLVTVVLAGGAAYLTGRAVARSWESNAQLGFYIFLLSCACRFIHYALFQGTLLTIHYFIVDLIVLAAIAFLGKRVTRANQMSTQYKFEYQRNGPLGWTRRT